MQSSVSPAYDDVCHTEPVPVASAVLSGPEQFELQPQQVPVPREGEVLIRLEGCGICASSLPLWQGRSWFEYPQPPGAPGHEGWGRIAALDRGVRERRPELDHGRRVTFLCDNAFAGYATVPVERVVALPDRLGPVPFPGEAIGCAMNIFRRADIRRGHFTAIIGAGFLGLLLVQLAVGAGARVVALTRRASARELAEGFGAEATFDTQDWWGNARRVVEMSGGRGCDRVVEATGMQFALDLATEIIGEYGTLVIAGYHQDGLRQVDMQKWNWRGIDVVNAHERDMRRVVQGMSEGIEAVESGAIRLDRLLTHSFPLGRLDDGFRMMMERPHGFVKGWVQL